MLEAIKLGHSSTRSAPCPHPPAVQSLAPTPSARWAAAASLRGLGLLAVLVVIALLSVWVGTRGIPFTSTWSVLWDMRAGGEIAAEGDPATVMTAELVEEVSGLPCRIIDDPETGTPLVVPTARKSPAMAGDAVAETLEGRTAHALYEADEREHHHHGPGPPCGPRPGDLARSDRRPG